jgi:hypothetical protein
MTDATEPTRDASSHGAPAAAAPPTTDDSARRLLTGDRLCAGCGHNLVNQPIVREPHYQLLIARCPECGTAAPLQEYPLLGRWAGRLAALGAVAWGGMLLALILGAGVGLFTAGMIGWGASQSIVSNTLDVLHAEDTAGERAGPLFMGPANPLMGMNTAGTDFATWYAATQPAELHRRVVAAREGRWSVAGAAIESLLAFPFVLAAGVLIAVILLGRRPAVATLLGGGPSLVVAIALYRWIIWMYETDGVNWSYDAAMLVTGWRVVLFGILLNAVVLGLGIWFGRPMVRGLVRLGVPPRLRGSLAFLWLADDRPLPPGVTRNRGPRVH